MNFPNAGMDLSDNISGLITANQDECDNGRYLSVLSQDLPLENMNVTETNERVEGIHEYEPIEESNEIIFTVDENNQIFGIQLANDEDGNLQKYQIEYRENMNGDLEPMLDTIQLLQLEENCSLVEVSQTNDNFVITNEELIPQNLGNDFHLVNEVEQNNINQKGWNIHTTGEIPSETENTAFFGHSSILRKALQTNKGNNIDFTHTKDTGVAVKIENNLSPQNKNIESYLDQEELYEETIENNQFEQFFLEEKQVVDNQLVESVRDTSQDGLIHILNETTESSGNIFSQTVQTKLKETVDHQPKTIILKKQIQKSLLRDFIDTEQNIVFIQTLPEKENMEVMDVESFIKPSSRSLLKCNQPQGSKQPEPTSTKEIPQKSTMTKSRIKEVKQPQAYYRTKEAKQARQFMNFINSTTITQAPERKERLPRKQQIKPLSHPDENIIVKEMMVSSNGFIEPISADEKKFLPVTEYVELLDSGDEANCSSKSKKKKKNNKKDELIEIEISDTDEPDRTEVQKSMEDKAKNSSKKKRGRPPKNSLKEEQQDTSPNSPPKISRLDSDVESVTSTLQVIKMENIEADTNQESSKKKPSSTGKSGIKINISENASESVLKKGLEPKFECSKCESKFINKFLLNRHECIKKIRSNLTCDICKQKFTDIRNFDSHKKSHIKETPQLKTPAAKTSQFKVLPRKDTALISSTSKSSVFSRATTKNPRLSVLPPRQSLLPPRQSVLPPRQAVLPSRQSVLPTKQTIDSARPPVLPTKKSISSVKISKQLVADKLKTSVGVMNTPSNVAPENSVRLGSNKTKLIEGTPDKSTLFKCVTRCDKCNMQFPNNSLYFDHQVLVHGFNTPDKSIVEKKQNKMVKPKITHNGIHAPPNLAKSFHLLKNKMQQS